MEKQQSLLERKKEKTRDRLIKTAIRLFKKQGFENTSVDQIAEEAEVSRSTFFRYFGSKEMVAFPHHAQHLETFQNLLARERGSRPPLESVFVACRAMAKIYMENKKDHLEQQRIIQSSRVLIARGEELDIEWEEAIARTLLKSSPSTEIDLRKARLVAGAIIGLIRSGLKQWYLSDCRWNLTEIVDEASALIRV
jgi:AcrR family transcriptional regulator